MNRRAFLGIIPAAIFAKRRKVAGLTWEQRRAQALWLLETGPDMAFIMAGDGLYRFSGNQLEVIQHFRLDEPANLRTLIELTGGKHG